MSESQGGGKIHKPAIFSQEEQLAIIAAIDRDKVALKQNTLWSSHL